MDEELLALIKFVKQLKYMDGSKAQNEFTEIDILSQFKKVNNEDKEIEVQTRREKYCLLFYKEDFIKDLNYSEYLQFRIDIKEKCKEEPEWKGYKHYTLVAKGIEVKIDKNGEVSEELFDYVKYLIKLV